MHWRQSCSELLRCCPWRMSQATPKSKSIKMPKKTLCLDAIYHIRKNPHSINNKTFELNRHLPRIWRLPLLTWLKWLSCLTFSLLCFCPIFNLLYTYMSTSFSDSTCFTILWFSTYILTNTRFSSCKMFGNKQNIHTCWSWQNLSASLWFIGVT